MSIKTYRKKPVLIRAVQFQGDNFSEIMSFCNKTALVEQGRVLIKTLEGVMEASPQDYIIEGVNGEFYPCKPDIFEKTYDYEGVNGE